MKTRTYIVLLIIGFVGLGLWLLVGLLQSRKSARQQPAPIVAVAGKDEQILGQDKIFFPGLVENGKAIIGLTDHGTRLTRIDVVANTSKQLNDAQILSPTQVSYAPDGSAAIVYSKEVNKPAVVTLYDFAGGTQKQLDAGISHVVWANDSKKIFYLFSTDAGTSLVSADPAVNRFDILLARVPYPDMELTISPGSRYLSLTRNVLSGDLEQPLDYPLYLVDLKDNSLHEQPPKGLFDPHWAPTGNRLAYLRYDPATQTAHVTIYDIDSQSETPSTALALPGTFTWRSADELLVASPASPGPTDLTQGLPTTNENTFVTVSKTGKVTPLTSILTTPAVDTLLMSPDGNTVYFRRLEYLRRQKLA